MAIINFSRAAVLALFLGQTSASSVLQSHIERLSRPEFVMTNLEFNYDKRGLYLLKKPE